MFWFYLHVSASSPIPDPEDFVSSGIYNQQELSSYFQALEEIFQQNKLTKPVAINVTFLKQSNGGHTFTVIYNPLSKTWMPSDINELSFEKTSDTTILAQKIYTSFRAFQSFRGEATDHILFSSQFRQFNDPSEKLSESLEQLKAHPGWDGIHTGW